MLMAARPLSLMGTPNRSYRSALPACTFTPKPALAVIDSSEMLSPELLFLVGALG